MTNYVPTQSISTTGQHALSLVTGDNVLLNPGIVLSASGAGADGIRSGGTSNYITLLSGSQVMSQMGTGLHVGLGSYIQIASGASVSGQAFGAYIFGLGESAQAGFLRNYGSISGGTGVKFGDGNRLTGDALVNGGSIRGTTGAGIEVHGSVTITNIGAIQGQTGIVLSHAINPRMIVNSGSIVGEVNAINFAPTSHTTTIGDTVINTGHIRGAINFGSQGPGPYSVGDLYDGRGGTITGTIFLDRGNDRAYGGAGAETFDGAIGNDTIDGGGGNDTVIFSSNRSQYDVSTVNGVTTVAAKSDPTLDTDTLTNVRFLKFRDTTEILYNTKPDSVGLTQTAFAENALTGTPIATVAARDAEGDALTYTLVDPTGTFGLVGNALVLLKALDFETRASYSLTLTATDAYGLATSQTVAVGVTNVIETTGLTLSGTAGADSLTGENGNDLISGAAGRDALSGLGGNDRIAGGAGRDVLTGGADQDIFVFDTRLARTNKQHKASELDTISDFNVADDTIHLAKSVFSKISKVGILTKSAFHAGTKSAAHDANDRIVYNKNTGALLYDKDGTGGAEAIQIATLSTKLALKNTDFFVI
ncbi:hypothetical protein [Microvirga sp. CF3016]|uniref:hypothetical protein n=1 Tax=Microvirga sp. CF3016 TaxID=3110181 RepID=UPI002E760F2D|nr:hypothetical protein [Microvirga sp. CF3016]MEE1612026.1 hypothetical protein [Microvirga sp. CF3016]